MRFFVCVGLNTRYLEKYSSYAFQEKSSLYFLDTVASSYNAHVQGKLNQVRSRLPYWFKIERIAHSVEAFPVMLGNGMNQNATERTVAISCEYTDTDDFTMSYSELAVDYRFKADGGITLSRDFSGQNLPVCVPRIDFSELNQ